MADITVKQKLFKTNIRKKQDKQYYITIVSSNDYKKDGAY